MRTNSDVEEVLSRVRDHVLVGCNAGGLETLARQLLVLVADHVNRVGEIVARDLLLAGLVDADLGIRHTAAIPGLRKGLVLAVAVALGGAATHACWREGSGLSEQLRAFFTALGTL